MIRQLPESESPLKSQRDDVAIIGMACTYPDARDLQTFWQNILNKVDAVKEVPKERWDPEIFHDPDPQAEGRVYCKMGGYLGKSFCFNPLNYGTMPKAIEGAEPDQFLVLRCAYEAMADAGYLENGLDGVKAEFILGRGNYLGAGLSNLLQRSVMTQQTLDILRAVKPDLSDAEIEELRKEMRSRTPSFGSETAPGLIPNITTGRVANRLDFMGANFTVDAACASSLIATELAVRNLLSGHTDFALVGGVHVFTNVPFLMVFCALGALSHTSVCRPFDNDCDGTISGEGVGLLALKRLSDAERDNDRIYAVIKGTGSASDGRAVSVTAPRTEGEELALQRAYEMSGVDPRTVGLIEAHGTGTPVGDKNELTVLNRIFGSRTGEIPNVALGSIKSMIGHAMPAAGAAALIKTTLALYHRVLPPTLHCREPHELLQQSDSRFYVNSESRPWIHGDPAAPRRAGVNAFGFGGINAHVVLEEYQPERTAKPTETLARDWDSELCVVEARTRGQLIEETEKLSNYASRAESVALRDIAYTLNTSLQGLEHRLAIVATSVRELGEKARRAADRLQDPQVEQIKDTTGIFYFARPLGPEGKMAFLFPGEGSQYVNMMADLCIHFPEVRACFDAADAAIQSSDRYPPSASIFPPPAFTEADAAESEARLWKIERATEAVLAADGAMYTLMQHLGVRPDVIAGHSAGEWAGMVAAGVLDVNEFVSSMRNLDEMYRRVQSDTSIPRAAMLAVGADRVKVADLVRQIDCEVFVANDNCPHQVVVVIATADCERVMKHLLANGVFVDKLPYDRGYHTPVFTYICEPLRKYFDALSISPAETTLYSCTTAEPFPASREEILDLVSNTFARPIVFRDMISRLYEDGTRIFVEIGPQDHLTGFVNDILRGERHLAIATNSQRRSGLVSLHHAIGLLAAHHTDINFDYLYSRRNPQKLTFDPKQDCPVPESAQPGMIEIPLYCPTMTVKQRSASVITASNARVQQRPDETPVMQQIDSESARHEPIKGPSTPHNPSADAPVDALPPSRSSAAVRSHMGLMETFLQTQEDVMRAFLSSGPPTTTRPALPEPAPLSASQETASRATPETVTASTHAPEEPTAPVAGDADQSSSELTSETGPDLQHVLISIVSDKTGYPPEMLDLDVDMEADLGIDSIKRVEILGTLQKLNSAAGINQDVDMEEVAKLKTLRQILEFMESASPDRSSPDTSAEPLVAAPDLSQLPFSGQVVKYVPNQEVVVRRQVDLVEDLYLDDHRLGPKTSDVESGLGTLPVVPLTISVEMMIEIGALLYPHLKVTAIKDVFASKWIDIEHEGAQVHLEISARVSGEREVQVEIHDLAAQNDRPIKPTPLVQGTITLAEQYPEPPVSQPLELDQPRSCQSTAQQLYSEHRMFHGPRFQGVVSLGEIGTNGLSAQLEVLPRHNVLRSTSSPQFHTDPFFLDAVGQLVGYWPLEYYEEGFVLFPIRIAAIELFAEPMAPGTQCETQLRIREVTQRQLRADLDVIRPDNKLWMRIVGWEDWRFYWPQCFYEFWRFPNKGMISKRIELPSMNGWDDAEGCMLEPFGESDSSIWENLWAHLVLNSEELREYHSLSIKPKRTTWFFGRAVVKDAVRLWCKRHHGIDIYPVDIHVKNDSAGRPFVSGHWIERIGETPCVSISHKGSVAIGAASRAEIGIDLERVESRDESFDSLAFAPHEQSMLDQFSGSQRDEWVTRMWCAKEAAGKAIGIGLGGGSAASIVEEVNPHHGTVLVSCAQVGAGGRLDIPVHTERNGDLILAVAYTEGNGK